MTIGASDSECSVATEICWRIPTAIWVSLYGIMGDGVGGACAKLFTALDTVVNWVDISAFHSVSL
jgi:hypothetical protein